jgi:hypothetical protein
MYIAAGSHTIDERTGIHQKLEPNSRGIHQESDRKVTLGLPVKARRQMIHQITEKSDHTLGISWCSLKASSLLLNS